MQEEVLKPGVEFFTARDAPGGSYSAFFEDDGETGYFYAVDLTHPDRRILDALHIYNITNVVDRERSSTLSILWSAEGSKCALLINGYPHGAFDFEAKRGYCRNNFPNFPTDNGDGWHRSDHSWEDEAVAWVRKDIRQK